MKTKTMIQPILAILLIAVLISCKKDEYTIEDKAVTGNMSYTRTAFVPFEVDPVTQQPLKASITMEGTGTLPDMGELHMVSTFKADLVTMASYDFVTTYTGSSSSDIFSSTGAQEILQNGSIKMSGTFFDGKGKFAKIKGGGETIIVLSSDQSSGTGTVNWTVTY